ncbi:hypothetical protein TcBrA4_0071490 [Trypanosoma cruzi]|nr:hypothetical protein TcBrA4_0071490 [Trypanosoma cruzi]
MLRSVLQMDRTPLDMVILGLQKIAARLERKRARPLTREWVDGYPHSRADWKQRVVFRPAWITGELSFRDCGLNPQQFPRWSRTGSIILDWSVASRTARAGRVRPLQRYAGHFEQRKLHESTMLTERSLFLNARPLTKQGALRRAAPIVETCNLDPHVILQLAMHVDPFDLPQSIV